MIKFMRHALAIAILPFTVTILIPFWIAQRYDITLTLGLTPAAILLQAVAVLLLISGLALFIASLRRFATEGKGTLAPWDPPRQFVVHGPYRFVRNPMISGVILILFGEACALLSRPHAIWATFALILNLIYIPAVEERQLVRRFGEPYLEYCRNVPRFVPRLTPWR